ncbi:MAG: LD-carboxypeptidase [Acidobacteria bacterium]|nr:LD-carboxypeptidase [Acidobacteriota bacterium]MBI3658817.1 LD-carboxypeptidase [Acidobacteriota bacterium]
MKRRSFLTGIGSCLMAPLATLATSDQSRRKVAPASDLSLIPAAALHTGDTVGLITPASYVSDPDRLALVERTIKHFGLKFKIGKNVRKRTGYLGGSIQERVDDLHDMFGDTEVRAILALRGGYGSAHLLDRLDYRLIRAHPKIFLGYSDITALHLAIHKLAGLITFHGPIALSRFSGFTQTYFRKALFEAKPLGAITNPPDSNPLRPEHTLRVVRPGRGRGRLIGGNLTLISTTMGTPYEIDTRGRLLFLEDVDEEPYRIDRMLTQLRLAGKFDEVAGVIIGECRNCRPRDYQPSFESTFSFGEVLDNVLGDLKAPVLSGLTIGHTDDQLTLPIGVMATLDAERGEIIIEEAAVRAR